MFARLLMTKQEPKKDDTMHEEVEDRDKAVDPDALDAVLEGEGFGEEHEQTHPHIEPQPTADDLWRVDAPEILSFDDEPGL